MIALAVIAGIVLLAASWVAAYSWGYARGHDAGSRGMAELIQIATEKAIVEQEEHRRRRLKEAAAAINGRAQHELGEQPNAKQAERLLAEAKKRKPK